MAGETLFREEVEELCRTPIKARQLAFLKLNGIRHHIDEYTSRIIVLRADVGAPMRSDAPRPVWHPNKVAR